MIHPPSSLNMKNSHRARVEKNLEDMMGNDWRVFRAQLVAQEAAERQHPNNGRSPHQRHQGQANSANTRSNTMGEHEEVASQPHDDKQARQEKFGNIFAAIFSNSNKDEDPNSNSLRMQKGAYPAQRSIFDGHNIGGATPDSMIPDSCEDPFVSEAEIPVLLKPKVLVDKHRWAHPLSHIEPGCVLIANEKLGGVFHQTVVLIIEHNEGAGSTGIVINRPLSGNLLKIASETKSNVDLSLKLAFNSAAVTYGGPVLQEEYSVLHGYGNVDGSKKVAPGVFVGGSEELMKEVRKRNLHASDVLFVKGHAAWVPNQLAREISKGVWYTASCSSDFLLRYAGAPVSDDDNEVDLWSDILTCMGNEYAEIAMKHSGKGDRRMMP
eukprot:CAMPEP_0203658914 /NCGR_PEP_ID=MMETSP0088-20131115/49909_1 /ASSEMBLY_ACC=CAM_ASM_001087 /TAXON_ID=426623 /ORGANISM="Chaetoceros affinis, Strain CCMP159" /LENGTH=379 /DNA_ID=CAMNT_0050520749 /DNA_START=159 /DNA_END=1298 /DNA_ORIENTATION=+